MSNSTDTVHADDTNTMRTDWSRIHFFKPEEFYCPCCGREEMKHDFTRRLDIMREFLKTPMKISSGWRCPEYNKSIGGAENSPHMLGLAADISAKSARYKRRIVREADACSLYGIGVYDAHIHVDDDPRWHKEMVIFPGISK